jgi:hypothetical protein
MGYSKQRASRPVNRRSGNLEHTPEAFHRLGGGISIRWTLRASFQQIRIESGAAASQFFAGFPEG